MVDACEVSPLEPKIVGVVRKPGGTAIGAVLIDGCAKLPFVRSGNTVITGKEARIALGKGQWLAAKRLHNCFKSPLSYTVSHGLTVRRLTIVEFVFDDRSEYVVVSQAAKLGGGYVERFRSEDPLIGAFYCKYRMDPDTVKFFGASEDFITPNYEMLTECAAEARRIVSSDRPERSWGLEEIMFQAVIQWWPWEQGKDVMMFGLSFKVLPDGSLVEDKIFAVSIPSSKP